MSEGTLNMEPQEVSIDVFLEKYAKNGEKTIDENMHRVAKALAVVDDTGISKKYEEKFYQALKNGFVPGGRIWSAAGLNNSSTLINCFIIPVGDSVKGNDDDGNISIFEAVAQAAEVMRKGGGVGYDFSRIRPNDAYVKGTQSKASGPVSYMKVFDATCQTVESAGCFAGSSLINTTDGLHRVKNIVESDKDFYAVTHMGPKKITTKFKNGIKPIWRVLTKYGFSVDVTPEHKFAQFEDGKIVTKEIRDIVRSDNQNLLLSIPLCEGLEPKYDKDEKFAYVIGAFHGNGTWLTNEKGLIKGISISNNVTKMKIVEDIDAKMTSLGFKGSIKKRPYENVMLVNFYDAVFFRELEERGVTKGDMSIPPFILEGSKEVRAAYLAGLFDADGHFHEGKSNIRLRMISYKLLQEVQVVLASLGVMSKMFVEREPIGNWNRIHAVAIYGRYAQEAFLRTVGKFTNQTLVNLSSRDGVGYSHKWADIRGFGLMKSQFSKFWPGDELKNPNISMNAIINSGVTIPELVNTVSTEILGIVELPEEETYDLEVEDVHLLSGNGIYTSNSRRGAQMSVLRCDHPDIFEFVTAKKVKGTLNNFNISVGVTDGFMEAVLNKQPWQLVHKSKPCDSFIVQNDSFFDAERNVWVWKTVNASDLWEVIMTNTYEYAEPGILFLDKINRDNNLYYAEEINATNPCGEQPLPSHGCCDLGSINLTKFINNPFTLQATFDFNKLIETIHVAVRMLDNVLDVTAWPLVEQQEEAKAKRRIGVGYIGVGDACVMMCKAYNSPEGVALVEELMRTLRDAAYEASVKLAKEKGPFPLFDREQYLNGEFVKRLPQSIQDDIAQHGIRNSHLLSIAPTGTISLAFADNASNGIEPPFSWVYNRTKRMSDGSKKVYEVTDHAYRLYRALGYDTNNLPSYFVTALDMTVQAHTDIMAVSQPYIDSAISKTINIPADYPFEDFKDVYIYAWKKGLKGITTYRPNNVLGAVLEVKPSTPISEEVKPVKTDSGTSSVDIYDPNSIDAVVKEMHNTIVDSREDGLLEGFSVKGKFSTMLGQQKFLVTINYKEIERQFDKYKIVIKKPIEFILTSNFSSTASSWSAAMRQMSLSARYGAPLNKIIENLKEITWEHGLVRYGFKIKDGKRITLSHPSDVAAIGYAIEETLVKKGYLTSDGQVTYNYDIVYTDGSRDIKSVNTVSEKQDVKIDIKMTGNTCPECGDKAVIRKDGCEFCTNCGHIGSCG